MVKLIGKPNCSRCDMVKKILKDKNIDFEYVLLDELEDCEKKDVLNQARATKMMEMPIIIKDEQIKTLQEVL